MKTLGRISALLTLLALGAGCAQSAAPTLPGLGAAGAAGSHRARATGALVWTQTDAVKVRPQDAPIARNRSVALAGAQGETVAFQVLVYAGGGALSNVDVALTDLSDGQGHTIPAASSVLLYRQYYLDLVYPSGSGGATGLYPDGLVPMGKDPYYHERRNGSPFNVPAHRNQGVWGDVEIPGNAVPGVYKGTASVTSGGAPLASVPVTVTVWNFALPPSSSLTTAFGFNTWSAYLGHYGNNWNTQKIETLTNLYQAEALKHRISLYENDVAGPNYTYNPATHKITSMDYTLFDSTYVPDLNGSLVPNGARATTAEVPDANPAPPGAGPGPNDAEYVAFWKAVGAHFAQQGWTSRNFYYDLDEPSTAADFKTVAYRADLVHKADPSIRVMDTTHFRQELAGHVDIWDPIVNELDSPGFPSPAVYAARQKLGEQVWFYTSNNSLDSYGPWPNFFVDRGMNDTRIFSWMAWRYGLNGFLYYGTVIAYERYPNPWNNVYAFGDNGDGTLFYPGRVALIGGKHDIPCPSIRLEMIRGALQDYEYMALLKAKGQSSFVDALVRKLVVKTNNWTQDPQALESARAEMAAKLGGAGASARAI